MKTVDIRDEAHWHSLRATNIGSSESAALFERSPYTTKFMLWQVKAGRAEVPGPDHERVDWGKMLEGAIAEGVTREMRWNLEHRAVYCTHDTVEGMGCTVDRWVIDNERGPGVVEIKNVDWLQWRQNWTESQAPFHIELQLQHQLAITGYSWGAIAVLIGGNDLKIYERRPDPDAIIELEDLVGRFWETIRACAAPNAFGDEAELPVLAQLHPKVVPASRIDSADIDIGELAQQFAWAHDQVTMFTRIKDQAKVKLLEFMGDAAIAYVPGHRIKLAKPQIAARTQTVKAHVQQRLTVEPLATEAAMAPTTAGDVSPFI